MGNVRVPDLNQVIIAGRLTRDPELKYTSGGQAYCKLGLANSRFYKDKNGERQETTTFVDVTVWGPHAEFVGKYTRKGKAVLVEARLQTSEWEDKQTGQKRSRLELNAHRVTQLEWDDDRPGGGSAGGSAPRPARAENEPTPHPPMDEPVPEDDIPF
jgi:single-strand DNA-binding protein